jgi:uncharacterized protein (TIGR02678 family)
MSDVATPRTARRIWQPEANREVADVLRVLMLHPWLVAGRDDDTIAKVRLHADALRDVLARLGWVLVVERDLVRLRKSPPARRGAYAAGGPNPRTCQWFFCFVAAAESMGRRVALGGLVAGAQAAAAEAGIAVTGDMGERHARLAALRMLTARGVLEELDGTVADYLHDENPPVLLAVHHTRLLHVIANFSPDHDPAEDPDAWLDSVEREPDVARRMRRRLVDDTVVHACDLDDAEADWLSRRLRDDGAPLADAFGLHLERRSEGAAFVVSALDANPARNLGPLPFPASGTVAHAALLVCNWVVAEAGGNIDRPGWRRVSDPALAAKLTQLAEVQQSGSGGWSAELAADPAGRLKAEVAAFLEGLDLVRPDGDGWLFSPAVARWPTPRSNLRRAAKLSAPAAAGLFDGAPE